jgi:tetratricopeptide (TPR) repeat protein
VLQVLGRDSEALSASEKAVKLFPENPLAHITLAGALAQLDRQSEAEKELLKAVAIAPSEYTWSALADFYQRQDRVIDAIAADRKATDLEAAPAPMLLRCSSSDLKRGTGENSFLYKVATGRAEAWQRIGDIGQAAKFQKQAAQLAPNAQRAWLNLAQLDQQLGRSADAERARAHAANLPNN